MINYPFIRQPNDQINTSHQSYNSRHATIAIILLLLLFCIIIITIAILQPLLNHTSVVLPSSNTPYGFNSSTLPDLDLTIKNQVASAYNLSEEQINNLSTVIRENTIKSSISEPGNNSLAFIVDLNDPEVTYQVSYHPPSGSTTLSCPSIELAQNQDVFCYGTDGQSTITANLSQHLPYQGITQNGTSYSISHRYDDLTSDPYLTIYASVCGDETLAQEVETEVKKWIKSKGIPNPDIIPLHFSHSYCNDRD